MADYTVDGALRSLERKGAEVVAGKIIKLGIHRYHNTYGIRQWGKIEFLRKYHRYIIIR